MPTLRRGRKPRQKRQYDVQRQSHKMCHMWKATYSNTIVELFVNQIGNEWENKVKRDLESDAPIPNVQDTEHNHIEMNIESDNEKERGQERAHTPSGPVNNQHGTRQQQNSTNTKNPNNVTRCHTKRPWK